MIDVERVIAWAHAHGCTCTDGPDVVLVWVTGIVTVSLYHDDGCRMLLARAAPWN